MARIPRINQVSRISTNVGREAVSEGGQLQAQAVGELGQSIQQFGGVMAQLSARRDQEEIANQKSVANAELIKRETSLKQSLNEKYKDTDHFGYMDEYNEGFTTILEEINGNVLKNPKAAEEMAPIFSNYKTVNGFRTSNQVQKYSEQYYTIEKLRNRNANLEAVRQTGSFDGALTAYRQDLVDIETSASLGQYDATRAEELKKGTSIFLESAVNGALMKGSQTQLLEARKIVSGEDKRYSDLLQHVTNAKQMSLFNKIDNELTSLQRSKVIGLQQATQAEINAIKAGISNPQDVALLKNSIESSVSDPNDKNALLSGIDNEVIISNLKSQVVNNPKELSNIDKIIDNAVTAYEAESPIIAKNLKASLTMEASQIASHIQKEVQKDPAKFFYANSPGIKGKADKALSSDIDFMEYKASMDETYDKWGIPQTGRRYVTPNIEAIGKDIKENIDLGNYKGVGDSIQRIGLSAKGQASSLLLEMGIDPEVALTVETGTNAGKALNVIGNYKEIEKAYKGSGASKINDIKSDLRESSVYQGYFNGFNPQSQANAEAVLDLASKNYASLVVGGMSESKAKERAFSWFQDANTIIDFNNYTLLIPNSAVNGGIDGISKDKISDFSSNITTYFDAEDIKHFNINVTGPANENDFADSVRDSGFMFYDRSSNSLQLAVMRNGSPGVVKTKEGKPLSFPLNDILQKTVTKKSYSENVKKAEDIFRNKEAIKGTI